MTSLALSGSGDTVPSAHAIFGPSSPLGHFLPYPISRSLLVLSQCGFAVPACPVAVLSP